MKTVAIIQARMQASRLPNKMLIHIHGFPLCEWVYRRVLDSKKLDLVVFAITNQDYDDVLELYLESIGAKVFRGDENDLVNRYYQVAQKTNANNIVRVCADNPLICGSEIDRLIEFFNKEKCDYAYNHIPKGNNYPDGLGAEICSLNLIEKINQNANGHEQREHLFNYVINNPDDFDIRTFEAPVSIAQPQIKLDIDTLDDLKKILGKNYKIDMSAEEIIKIAME
jgi:spore coat polysaccharide biosynthesis protein SpsF